MIGLPHSGRLQAAGRIDMKHTESNWAMTCHSQERASQRMKLGSASTRKVIKHGILHGKSAEQYTGRRKSFLEHMSRNGCRALVYRNYCFIVAEENICITVYKLPAWFNGKSHYSGKEKIRKYKTYMRLNQYEDYCEELAAV